MKTLLCVLVGVMLFGSVGYGAHDLTCYEMIEPDTGTEWIEAGVPITPTLGIANLGEEAEVNLPVEFIAIDEDEGDTVFADTQIVDYIGSYPDSTEVEFGEWTPDGYCDAYEPFRYYELLGIVDLETDEDRTNDTIRREVTCLLSHDVGVIDMTWPEEPDELPGHYYPGSKITVTAAVENFGYHEEHDIHVRAEVRDVDSNNILIWHNVRSIDSLDWRGNESGNPYTVDVTFPPFTIQNEHCLSIGCRTELETDECPEDDHFVPGPPWFGINCWDKVWESKDLTLQFSLDTPGEQAGGECQVRFEVPHTSLVKLDVFDAGGRWVCSLKNDICEPGHHYSHWNGRDAAGRKVAAGIYLVRMEADGFKAVRKLVIIN